MSNDCPAEYTYNAVRGGLTFYFVEILGAGRVNVSRWVTGFSSHAAYWRCLSSMLHVSRMPESHFAAKRPSLDTTTSSKHCAMTTWMVDGVHISFCLAGCYFGEREKYTTAAVFALTLLL